MVSEFAAMSSLRRRPAQYDGAAFHPSVETDSFGDRRFAGETATATMRTPARRSTADDFAKPIGYNRPASKTAAERGAARRAKRSPARRLPFAPLRKPNPRRPAGKENR